MDTDDGRFVLADALAQEVGRGRKASRLAPSERVTVPVPASAPESVTADGVLRQTS